MVGEGRRGEGERHKLQCRCSHVVHIVWSCAKGKSLDAFIL